MKVLGERSIASFIRFVLDAAWWMGVIALALFVVLLVFPISNREGSKLTMDLPVAVELTAPIHGSSGSIQADARLEKLRGNLRFAVRKDAFFFGNMLLVALLLGFLLLALTQLRHIFRSISQGKLFIPENARRIRWVGFAALFGELARAGLVYFWSYYMSLHFTAEGLRFVAWTDLSGAALLSGLAILVIAEVFREGTRLQQEQSLTI